MDGAEGGVQVGRLRSAVIARSVSDEAIQAYFNKAWIASLSARDDGPACALAHHHQRADRNAVIEIDDVFIGHAEAA